MSSEPCRAAGLDLTRIAKSYNGRRVLQPLDLRVEPGEIHALLGENGSGKSTLIKILAGVILPDHDSDAEARVAGESLEFGDPTSAYRLGCRFVHQDLGLIGDLSVADNILLNSGFPTRWGTIRSRQVMRTVEQDLSRVGLDISPRALAKDLSPATRTGVAVARAMRTDHHSAARVVVFDEPTATLPDHEVSQLMSSIRAVAAQGIAIIYVTHRLDEVFEITENLTVLRDGHRISTVPSSTQTRSSLVHLMIGDEYERVVPHHRTTSFADAPVVMTVDRLEAGVIKDASFSVRQGEILGITGLTGSGSESILSAAFGRSERVGGTVTVADAAVKPSRPDLAIQAGVAYLPAERKTCGGVLEHTAVENLSLPNLPSVTRRFMVSKKLEASVARDWFSRLAVRPANGLSLPLATFSGGNQQKVLFAKWLQRKPAVFLLDEPTQGVDIGAKALLHRELLASAHTGTAMVVSSTDVEELETLCDRVLVFRRGRIIQELHGSAISATNITRATIHDETEVPA